MVRLQGHVGDVLDVKWFPSGEVGPAWSSFRLDADLLLRSASRPARISLYEYGARMASTLVHLSATHEPSPRFISLEPASKSCPVARMGPSVYGRLDPPNS